MKVGFFQYGVIWRDSEANLAYIRSRIKDSTFDLLVLPELFTSGYTFESRDELMLSAENLEVTPMIIPIRALENQCFYISCNRIGTDYFLL